MKRSHLIPLTVILIAVICLHGSPAEAGRWGGGHRFHHHRHSHNFWPGFAFGLGAAAMGSSIYHYYHSPRYVYLEPPVVAVGPCPGDRRCPPPYPCDDGCQPSGQGVPETDETTTFDETPSIGSGGTNSGHYHTETYWQEGHYGLDGRWVEGRYLQREKRWVQTGPALAGTGSQSEENQIK